MNHLDQSLNRLFKAASKAPAETLSPLPFALEARTLAKWRTGDLGDDALFLTTLLRRAFICAGVIMLASIGWSRFEIRANPAETSVRAHYEIALQVLP